MTITLPLCLESLARHFMKQLERAARDVTPDPRESGSITITLGRTVSPSSAGLPCGEAR